MSSKLTTAAERQLTTQDWLENPTFRNALNEASPRDYNAVALARAVYSMVRNDAKLNSCDTRSILNSVMICAQTGLLPGPMGLCALIPYGKECTWQLMFKGAVHLVARSGFMTGLQCEVVYDRDEFDYDEGSNAYVRFKRSLDAREAGRPIAAFASIMSKDGTPSIRVMGIAEIERIRDKYSRGKREERPWVTEFDEQACKTVLKRTLKRLPMSTEMMNAVAFDDLAEVGKPQNTTGITLDELPATPDAGFCNNDLEEGMVCSLGKGHDGAHQG